MDLYTSFWHSLCDESYITLEWLFQNSNILSMTCYGNCTKNLKQRTKGSIVWIARNYLKEILIVQRRIQTCFARQHRCLFNQWNHHPTFSELYQKKKIIIQYIYFQSNWYPSNFIISVSTVISFRYLPLNFWQPN